MQRLRRVNNTLDRLYYKHRLEVLIVVGFISIPITFLWYLPWLDSLPVTTGNYIRGGVFLLAVIAAYFFIKSLRRKNEK